MTEHERCLEKETLGNHGARINHLEEEEANTRKKVSDLYKKFNSLAAAPGAKANKEISAVKLALVVAVVTAVVQVVSKVLLGA